MPSSWSTSSSPCTSSWRHGGAFSFALEVLTDRPGYLVLRATGKDAKRAFHNETGGHRYQRVPPTERSGRVHSSTITVAVMPEPTAAEVHLDPRDLEVKTCRGSGAGGQHRNMTDSAVQLTHRPSGIMVRVESERSQHQNREAAESLLRARLGEKLALERMQGRNDARRSQVGTAMRSDKRRTVALQRGQVVDHLTGKKTTPERYKKGYIDDLWK